MFDPGESRWETERLAPGRPGARFHPGRDRAPAEVPVAVPAPVAAEGEARPPQVIFAPILEALTELNEYLAEEFASSEPFIHELLQHISRFSGKQLRPACLFLAARAVGGEIGRAHIQCAGVIELIHTATLVHDDVLDEAELRRRVETVNKRWGERAAVLLGDFIYSRGFGISTEVPGVSGLLAATTHTICEGELLQVGSAFDIALGEDAYYEIIRKKTAALYGMACRLGAQLSGADRATQVVFDEFGQDLGMAFQISDDALDLVGDEQVVGKSLGSDLEKGKLTLPLIRLREMLTGGKLEEYMWLLKTPRAQGRHVRVLRILQATEVLASVRRRAAEYIESALLRLDRIPENPVRPSLEALARFVIDRCV